MIIEQLRHFRFPSVVDWDLATITLSVSDLTERLGVELQLWVEDGLGGQKGFALGPQETPVLIREPDMPDPSAGTVLIIDGGEAVASGHHAVLHRVLAMLGLGNQDVSWVPDDVEEWREGARRCLEAHAARALVPGT